MSSLKTFKSNFTYYGPYFAGGAASVLCAPAPCAACIDTFEGARVIFKRAGRSAHPPRNIYAWGECLYVDSGRNAHLLFWHSTNCLELRRTETTSKAQKDVLIWTSERAPRQLADTHAMMHTHAIWKTWTDRHFIMFKYLLAVGNECSNVIFYI